VRKIFFVFLLSIYYLSPPASQAQGAWTQKANFAGNFRAMAVGFSIGNKGYIGTGSDTNLSYKNDFWEYNPIADSWTQKANFGGGSRIRAVGFAIGDKGYIGTGYDGNNWQKDFWEYDTTMNTWSQKTNFGGTPRQYAVGFSIGSKGYIGLGSFGSNYYNDFWQYNQGTDTWVQKANFVGGAREQAVGFSIGSKGYIGTGHQFATAPPYYFTALWEYDTIMNTWTQKANFSGTARSNAIGFSIGSKAYIGTGFDSTTSYTKDFWEYDQSMNIWTQKTNLPASQRSYGVGFSIGTKGYIGTGADGGNMYNDFWEFVPSGNGIDEINFKNSLSLYPNPSVGFFTISSDKYQLSKIEIYNLQGENIYQQNNTSSHLQIDLSSQPKGIYFVKTQNGNNAYIEKVIIQ